MTNLYRDLDMPLAVRELTDECGTCHGEWVDVLNNEPCPQCGGDANTVLETQLRLIQRCDEIQGAVLQVSRRIQEVEAEAEMLDKHAAAITARIIRRRNAIAYIKTWMQLEMEAAQIDKLKDEFVTIWLQDNPPSIEITDPLRVPEEFQRATIRMTLADVPDEMREFVSATEPAKSDLRAYIENTGHVPDGVTYRAKGHRRHLRVLF
mgnify:CR=1 FL=1